MIVTSKCQVCKRKVELELSENPTVRGIPSPASYANSFQDAVNATCSICFKEKNSQAYQKGIRSKWKRAETSQAGIR
jgi:hypothetical protein